MSNLVLVLLSTIQSNFLAIHLGSLSKIFNHFRNLPGPISHNTKGIPVSGTNCDISTAYHFLVTFSVSNSKSL